MKSKIFLAFIIVAVIPAAITIFAANMFASRELEEIFRHDARTGIARVDANIVADLKAVAEAAREESMDTRWRRLFLRRRQLGSVFRAQLINELTVQTKQGGWEFSAIIDTAGEVLARGDRPSSFGDTLDYRTAFGTYEVNKPMGSAVMPQLPVWGTGGLLGISPIRHEDRILGYLLVGRPFTAEHLREWVGGWAISSMIVGEGKILNLTEGIPEESIPREVYTELYTGPPVSSMHLDDRRYLIGRKQLTRPGSGKPELMILLFFDSTPVDAAIDKLLYSMLATGGVGLILAIIFAAWVARLLTKPLDDIIFASQRISAGDWDADVISFSTGEAGRMADAFNKMIRDLRTTRDRLVYTERLAAWRDAARKVAHEVKNPLSPIQIAAEDLRSAYQGDDPKFQQTLTEATKTILDEVSAIRRFVDEFAAFARTPKPTFEHIDSAELLRETGAAFPEASKERQLVIDTSQQIGFIGDTELLRRALVNLVKNGLEAGGPKTRVSVMDVDEDDWLEFIVDDTGPGISDEMKDQLFTPYATDKSAGTGLGLVIVQGIVADHGGTVSVRESPEGGARFVVRLPKDPRSE